MPPAVEPPPVNASAAPATPSEATVQPPQCPPGLRAIMDKYEAQFEGSDDYQAPYPWRKAGRARTNTKLRRDFIFEVSPELAGQVDRDEVNFNEAEAIMQEWFAVLRSTLGRKLNPEEEKALARVHEAAKQEAA